jgi:hypothetical protein
MAQMDADDLYGLPLDQFVPERGALARALRADGRREDAAEVVALRKPSVAAWAVNQLVRTQTQAVAELFASGDKLLDAHRAAVSGRGDGRALRAAAEREREAVETLVSAARGLLTSNGHELSDSIIERVTDTLHAAALDEDARRSVGGGRLVRELRHVGLGMAASPGAAPAPKRRATATRSTRGAGKQAAGDAGAEAARAAEAEATRATEAKAARVAESAARRDAERSARSVQRAEERRDKAAGALQDAEDVLATARAEAGAAAEAHRRAQEVLDALRRSRG